MNAETISYIIQHNPDILGNIEEFRQLAKMMEVDEIHIFDKTGRIFTGTHPEYFNYTFDSGAQMNFFKPMMKNKSLRLCQEITPNTAEGKLVQYSAIWSSDGKFIVQVGMYPSAVLETTEKNELSYIFSLLQGNPGVSLYAVDTASGEIVGSTSGSDNGKKYSEIGLRKTDIKYCPKGDHLTVNGVNSYGIFEEMDNKVIGYIISSDRLYGNILLYTLALALCLLVIAAVFVAVVQKFTDHYIIGSIYTTNEKLKSLSDGNLDERFDIRSSLEFSEFSDHINHMVQILLSSTDKMSFVLNHTNMRIGVYEYNRKMKTVCFTEHIPEIFDWNSEEISRFSADYTEMQKFIDNLRSNPVENPENTYRFEEKGEMYIKLEEIINESDVLGVVIDVTEDIINLKKAQTERDYDLLTGLFNRRGMERRFNQIFSDRKTMGHGAVVVVDSDDMKGINDTYGHAIGDLYLKHHAKVFNDFDAPGHLAARTGGDEFVLLIYGYNSDEDVKDALNKLRHIQDNEVLVLDDGTELKLHFSFGYHLTYGRQDYETMISAADEYMYVSKRIRKQVSEGSISE